MNFFLNCILSFVIATPDKSVWHTWKLSNLGEFKPAMSDGKRFISQDWKVMYLSLYYLYKLSCHMWQLSLFYTPVFRRDVLWYGAVPPSSVRPSVRSSVRPTVSTKKHRCKWWIFFKFCTQVCLGVPSINLLFVLSYLIKYVHNSIISDFSIFGIHRVIFLS